MWVAWVEQRWEEHTGLCSCPVWVPYRVLEPLGLNTEELFPVTKKKQAEDHVRQGDTNRVTFQVAGDQSGSVTT